VSTSTEIIAFLKEHKQALEEIAKLAIAESSEEDEDSASQPNHGAAVKAREQILKVEAQLTWAEAFQREPPPALPKRRPGQAQLRVIAVRMVATGYSSTEIGKHLDVDRRTVNRWRTEPAFVEQLRELQAEANAEVHDLLVAGSFDIVRALYALATAPGVSDNARARACQLWMELLGRHKLAPVAPPQQQQTLETEEDVEAVLGAIPVGLLERHLAGRRKARDL
jgi:hypothetical protein